MDGFDDIDPNKKYVFIEDKHHIGDLDLLNNEAGKGENKSNIVTFTIMFAIIGVSTVFCCYLNYNFPALLSKNVFIMFLIAFVADLLVLRVFILFIYALLKCCLSTMSGYKKLKPT